MRDSVACHPFCRFALLRPVRLFGFSAITWFVLETMEGTWFGVVGWLMHQVGAKVRSLTAIYSELMISAGKCLFSLHLLAFFTREVARGHTYPGEKYFD